MQKIEATLLTMVIVHNEKSGEILLVNRPSKRGFPGYLGPRTRRKNRTDRKLCRGGRKGVKRRNGVARESGRSHLQGC